MSLSRSGSITVRRSCLWAAFWLGFSWPGVARAQAPAVPRAYPDELNVGQVRAGATAEATVRVIVPAPDLKGVKVSMQPPPFLRVEQARLRTMVVGNQALRPSSNIVCDLSVSFDTSEVGEFRGELAVEIAGEQFKVPVSISVLEQEPGSTRVLVLDAPFEGPLAIMASRSQVENWLELVKSAKLDVHYFRALEFERRGPITHDMNLSNFDVVIARLNSNAEESDFDRLKEFVESGGRVILCANKRFSGSVAKTNEFVAPFGLTVHDMLPKGQVRLIEIAEEDIAHHPLTAGVHKLRFDNPSPITVADEGKAEILVGAHVFEPGAYVARAKVGKGDVIVIGAFFWWGWISSDPKESDDALLLKNLLTLGRAPGRAR